MNYVYNIIIIYRHSNAVVDFSDFGVSYGIAFVALPLLSFHLYAGGRTEWPVGSAGHSVSTIVMGIFVGKVIIVTVC